TVRKRDPYLHRLYKNQLQEESEEHYGNVKCMLEKLAYPVLIASHIKPFILSDDTEAYDPNNGLLLSRTLDSLFDLKYISFDDEGNMVKSKRLSDDVWRRWCDVKLDNNLLNDKRKSYLAYHRELMLQEDQEFHI
ncbi:HNH endonuclease, partial [Neisseria gonorrhoeae]